MTEGEPEAVASNGAEAAAAPEAAAAAEKASSSPDKGLGKGSKAGFKGKGKIEKGKGKGEGGGYKGGGKGRGNWGQEMFYGGDTGDRIRPPATEAEQKEAQAIVTKAMIQAQSRQGGEELRNSAKVATATKEDLQAMLQARFQASRTK
eukprot:TRINITY_DN12382_c0_g1_i1.p1 TRINITY_DN12382_c0_g1~~TRINITY_DN12382_c0_g1_i1.p1  ORF type:complete len:148 (+),score=62.68 TRINITY_DN12382_c0_g1_i1:89-532(+)